MALETKMHQISARMTCSVIKCPEIDSFSALDSRGQYYFVHELLMVTKLNETFKIVLSIRQFDINRFNKRNSIECNELR